MQSPKEKYSQIIDMVDNNLDFGEMLEELDYSKSELLLAIHKLINAKETIPYHIKFNLTKEYLDNLSFSNLGGKKTIIISDTHLSSIYENLEYLERVEEFIKSNNLKYLLHAGDIGDGMVKHKKEYDSYTKQVSHILDVYSEFDNCHQYLIGGNHDRRYKDKSMDIIKLLAQKKNIEEVGYYQAYFNLYNKNISFEHNSYMNNNLIQKDLRILGHAHNTSFKEDKITIPTLSVDVKGIDSKPGFLIMDSKNKKGKVEVIFEEYNLQENSIKKVKEKKYII